MEYPPVLTKADFVHRYRQGEFGNAAPTWQTFDEFLESGYQIGLVHLRNRVAGGATHYNLQPHQALGIWAETTNKEQWYCSAMAPHRVGLIQGEIQQGPNGLALYYAPADVPMREALARGAQQVSGIMSNALLRYYMDVSSYEWMETLLDRYPGHVLEFSTFGICWGTVPNRNTVWWEVRAY